MPDRWAVVLAVAVFAGALAVVDGHVCGVAPAVALVVTAGGWLVASARPGLRPAVLCIGAALLAGSLAQRSLAGLSAPLAEGPVVAEVVLVGDPVSDGRGAVGVDVRLDGRRLHGTARLAAAAALDDRLAGERVTVVGEVRPPGPYERLVRHRHLAGRLVVDTVVGWRPGDGVTRLANGLRRTLARGAEVLSPRQASLLAGVTLGDDRAQPPDLTDAFRAAGLTHLLAVSGQNVAFVMVVAAPLLGRLRFGPRLVATIAVLALFALVTRAEPSVLRAVAMAAVAAVGVALGRPASAVRALSLGVVLMVLVDPLLATSLGFRLSVAGAAGIVVGADRIEALLPGPRWLAAPLAVTVAAQAAVSPLLVAAFGAVPLASLPANLLAVPAAGPLMVWGITAGLAAGVLGDRVAAIVHLPSRALLAWLEGVAMTAARRPIGDLRAGHLAGLAAAAVLVAAGRSLAARGSAGSARRGRRAVGAGGLALAAVLVAAALPGGGTGTVGPAMSGEGRSLGAGATLWVRGGAAVLVVDGRARAGPLLAGLRDAGVGRVDVVVLRSGARAAHDVLAVLRRGRPVRTVLTPAPPGGGTAAGTAPASAPGPAAGPSPPAGTVLDVGGLRLTVLSNTGGHLDVEVTPRPATAPAARTFGAGRSPPRSGPVPAGQRARRPRPGPLPTAQPEAPMLRPAPLDSAPDRVGGARTRLGWGRRRPILGRRDRARPPARARRRAGRADRAGERRPELPGAGRRRRAHAPVRTRGRGRGGRRRRDGPRGGPGGRDRSGAARRGCGATRASPGRAGGLAGRRGRRPRPRRGGGAGAPGRRRAVGRPRASGAGCRRGSSTGRGGRRRDRAGAGPRRGRAPGGGAGVRLRPLVGRGGDRA